MKSPKEEQKSEETAKKEGTEAKNATNELENELAKLRNVKEKLFYSVQTGCKVGRFFIEGRHFHKDQ